MTLTASLARVKRTGTLHKRVRLINRIPLTDGAHRDAVNISDPPPQSITETRTLMAPSRCLHKALTSSSSIFFFFFHEEDNAFQTHGMDLQLTAEIKQGHMTACHDDVAM